MLPTKLKVTFLITYQAMSYFVRIFIDFSEVKKENLRVSVLQNETPAPQTITSRAPLEAKRIGITPSPLPFSSPLVSLQMDGKPPVRMARQLLVRKTEAAVWVHRWSYFLTTSSHPHPQSGRGRVCL